jgi:hypothetical protein
MGNYFSFVEFKKIAVVIDLFATQPGLFYHAIEFFIKVRGYFVFMQNNLRGYPE